MELSHIYIYWLREIAKRRMNGLMVGDYSGTLHGVAIEGLLNLGFCKVKKKIADGIMIVEVTSSGRHKLKMIDRKKRRIAPKPKKKVIKKIEIIEEKDDNKEE